MLAQRDLDFHARVGIVAQNFDYAGDGLRMTCGLRDDLGNDDLPGLRRVRIARRHEKLLADAPVLRHHEEDALLVAQTADDAMVDMLEHLDDFGLRAAAAIESNLADGDAV